LGKVSLTLLLVHPLTLSVAYVPLSIQTAITRILPGTSWEINLGIISLLLLVSLLILTLSVKLPYELWRSTHKWLGIIFLIGVIHGFFVPSDITRGPILKNYMAFVISIGIVSYLYRTIFYKLLVKRFDYTVNKINYPTSDVIELNMLPKSNSISYSPGQFIFMSFINTSSPNEVHPFSLTSTPQDEGLSVAIKMSGDFTKKLNSVKVNDTVKIEGGFGGFSYLNYPNKTQTWIAGGIGVAPFISMMNSLKQQSGYNINLYYSARNIQEMVFLNKIKEISKATSQLKFIPWISEKDGKITAKLISKLDPDYNNKDILICGPTKMMKSLVDQFIKLGVKKGQLHTGEFAML